MELLVCEDEEQIHCPIELEAPRVPMITRELQVYEFLSLVGYAFSVLDGRGEAPPAATAAATAIDRLSIKCPTQGCMTPFWALSYALPHSACGFSRRLQAVADAAAAPTKAGATPSPPPLPPTVAASLPLPAQSGPGCPFSGPQVCLSVAGAARALAGTASSAAGSLVVHTALKGSVTEATARAQAARSPFNPSAQGRAAGRRGAAGRGGDRGRGRGASAAHLVRRPAEAASRSDSNPSSSASPWAGSVGSMSSLDFGRVAPARRPWLPFRLAIRAREGGVVVPLLTRAAALAAAAAAAAAASGNRAGGGGPASAAARGESGSAVTARCPAAPRGRPCTLSGPGGLLARPPWVMEPAAAFSRACVASPQWAASELQRRAESAREAAADALKERDEKQAALQALLSAGAPAPRRSGARSDAAGDASAGGTGGAGEPPRAPPAAWGQPAIRTRERLFGVSEEARLQAEARERREAAQAAETAGATAVRLSEEAAAAERWAAPASAVIAHMETQRARVLEGMPVAGQPTGAGAIGAALAEARGETAVSAAAWGAWWAPMRPNPPAPPAAAPALPTLSSSLAAWRAETERMDPSAVAAAVASGHAVVLVVSALGETCLPHQAAQALLLDALSAQSAEPPVGGGAGASVPPVPGPSGGEGKRQLPKPCGLSVAAAPFHPEGVTDPPPSGAGPQPAPRPPGTRGRVAGAASQSAASAWLGPDGTVWLPLIEADRCAATPAARAEGGGLLGHVAPDAAFWRVDPGLGAVLRPGESAAALVRRRPDLAWCVWELERRADARKRRRAAAERERAREGAGAAAKAASSAGGAAAASLPAFRASGSGAGELAAPAGSGFPVLSPSLSPATRDAILAASASAGGDAAVPGLELPPSEEASAGPSLRGAASERSAPRQGVWAAPASKAFEAVSGRLAFPTLGGDGGAAAAARPAPSLGSGASQTGPALQSGLAAAASGASSSGGGGGRRRKGRGKHDAQATGGAGSLLGL